ncbi:unnamed protein product [Paramecium sonneborni]|uniref:Uncharacterized protein n=1 Tax=Paramecium sonneborni TaxID=65129 RepID=A0A8S1MGR2_9CILI|nr:unnamed protein product [Paramecium sonneborni]
MPFQSFLRIITRYLTSFFLYLWYEIMSKKCKITQNKRHKIINCLTQMYDLSNTTQNSLNPLCNFFWINNSQQCNKYGKQLKSLSKVYCPYC